MARIGSLNGVSGAASAAADSTDPRQAALGTIGEIGHRVLAWVGAVGGRGDRDAFADSTDTGSEFAADEHELERGGDIYDLDGMTRELSARFGATPAEEGGLRRSLESFTREAVVQLAGLSGASPERQFAGISDALLAAGSAAGDSGVAAVTQRLDSATQVLARQNGS